MQNGIEVKVEASQGVNKLIMKLKDKTHRKAIANMLGGMLLNETNKYVPVNTGKLKEKGYVLRTGANKNGAWITLKYRNISGLPYVMYQYNGIVYGPNKAVFAQGPSRNGAAGVHTGWVSPIAPKQPTNRVLGHPKRTTIELRDGRIINITGYTGNKNAQARWLEYVRTTPTVWTPLRRKMLDETKEMVKRYLNG